MKGEVIGIATFQFIEGQNLNFAIPSERIASLNLKEEKKTSISEGLFEQEEKDKEDSDYAYEALEKALYYLYEKEYEKALPHWEIAIEIEPAAAYFSIGFCYEKLGAYTKEVKAYKQAINLNPGEASGHYYLGIAYYGLGLYKNALESYKQAIRIDPDYTNAYFRLGQAYFLFGRYKDAIEAYKQAIHIDPDYTNAYILLGGVYGVLGRHKDAIEAFKRVIRIEPGNIEAHFFLGFAYMITGDKNSALDEYKILKELDIDKANELFDFIY